MRGPCGVPTIASVATVFLHPLPVDGSVWGPVANQIDSEVLVVPSLYRLGETMTEWASAVAELAGRGPHTIVGNSIGASCAAEVAHIVPECVDRLVIVGGKLGHRPEPGVRDEAVRTLGEQGLDAAWLRYWAPLFGPHAKRELVEATRRRMLGLNVEDIVRGVRVFHGREDRSGLCKVWRGRLDVVSGAYDRSPTPDSAAAGLPLAREGQMHVVAGVGHYVPLEAPDDLVEVLLRRSSHG